MGRGQRSRIASEHKAKSMAVEVYGKATSQSLPDYDSILLEFPRDLTETEKERVSGLLAYWAKLPFVADGSTENKWLSDNQIWIDADSTRSRSADWRLRRPFEMLEDFIINGTEPRKRQNNSRAFSGIGLAPKRAILSHPQYPEPPLTKRPRRKITAAADLLRHR